MILQTLREALQTQGRSTRRDLAKQFNTSEEGIDAMLQVWLRKGRIAKETQCVCSGGCCGASEEVYYRWLGADGISIVVKH
ncbi:MAG: FeoC-like transcriptional regulator [Plesiomonas sp.]|uniref:FeoC-like transcriptional regulator n=1 Tax=Plesiomonas sp. TaxID=2486279 RepID=UPI003F33B397